MHSVVRLWFHAERAYAAARRLVSQHVKPGPRDAGVAPQPLEKSSGAIGRKPRPEMRDRRDCLHPNRLDPGQPRRKRCASWHSRPAWCPETVDEHTHAGSGIAVDHQDSRKRLALTTESRSGGRSLRHLAFKWS